MNADKPVLGERFEQALVHATRWHATQVRKGSGVPYVSHLLSVAALVLEDGGDEDEAIAALMHDAIEDQGGAVMREQIRALFGDHITEIVDGCTDAETTPKPPWRERKQQYIEHLSHAPMSVLRVSTADKLHNARSVLMDLRRVGFQVWDRFKGGREGTLWYYRSMVNALRPHGPRHLVDELDRVVGEIERLDAEMRAG